MIFYDSEDPLWIHLDPQIRITSMQTSNLNLNSRLILYWKTLLSFSDLYLVFLSPTSYRHIKKIPTLNVDFSESVLGNSLVKSFRGPSMGLPLPVVPREGSKVLMACCSRIT